MHVERRTKGSPPQRVFRGNGPDQQTELYNKLFYNVRGQLAEIRESTNQETGVRLAILRFSIKLAL
jgi:hypothetical protein